MPSWLREADEGAVFRQTFECAEKQQGAFFLYFLGRRSYFCLGVGENLGDEALLCLDYFSHGWIYNWSKSWSSPLGTGPEMISGVRGVVDKHRVDLSTIA